MSKNQKVYTDGQSPGASAFSVFLVYLGTIAFAMFIAYSISPFAIYLTIIPAGLVLLMAAVHCIGIYIERNKARKEADIELDRHNELLDALKGKDELINSLLEEKAKNSKWNINNEWTLC